jgi:hypothetical protein
MFVQSLPSSPLIGSMHALLALSAGALAWVRSPLRRPARGALKRGGAALGVAAGIVVLASLLCLMLPLPMKMIIPSDLLGGLHPASIDLLFASNGHSLMSMR